MAKKKLTKAIRRVPKTVLRLPDLDQAKSAVLNSLSSSDAQRGYRHAIEEFIEWYCSEPRLSFSKTVVLRFFSGTFPFKPPSHIGAASSAFAAPVMIASALNRRAD